MGYNSFFRRTIYNIKAFIRRSYFQYSLTCFKCENFNLLSTTLEVNMELREVNMELLEVNMELREVNLELLEVNMELREVNLEL